MNRKTKPKIAVALKYDSNSSAPVIIAKGKGEVAKRIINKAEEENIHTYEEKELAEKFINIDIGSEIPEEYYTAVAEILAFIFYLDKEKGGNIGE